jgi:hypothetical protein
LRSLRGVTTTTTTTTPSLLHSIKRFVAMFPSAKKQKMTMADQVGDNDKEEEYQYHKPIWLRGIQDHTGVLEGAILADKIVDDVEVNVDETFFHEQQDAMVFVEKLASLRGLKSFRLLPDKFDSIYDFPVPLLTTLLQRPQGLQLISLYGLDWRGSPEDFTVFLETLRHHPSLYLVQLMRCQFPEENSNSLLEDFFDTLVQMPKLRCVELFGAEESSLGILSQESLERISHAPLLEKLDLGSFVLSEDHFLIMMQWLERRNHNNRLTVVSLAKCTVTSSSLDHLARMLSINETLEELSIGFVYDRKKQTLTSESFMALSQSLQDNTSLRLLLLWGLPTLHDDKKIQTVFLTMLHRNCTLETLNLFDDGCAGDWLPDMDFWLALNRMGRKIVTNENATKQDWLQVITRSQGDLNCLYFFLSMKPELLDDTMAS